MKLQETGLHPDQFKKLVVEDYPEALVSVSRVESRVEFIKRQVAYYQGYLLFWCARLYNLHDAEILEIGTAHGFSAGCIAEGAPQAKIVTLNPKDREVPIAQKNLSSWNNVTVEKIRSTDYLAQYNGRPLDFIFVDGDHANVRLDFPFWNYLKVGGLMLHHDYSPEGSGRPTPNVFREVNLFSDWLGRKPDVLFIDDRDVGMAGFIRRTVDGDWKETEV